VNVADQILSQSLLLDLETHLVAEKLLKVGAVLGERSLFLKGRFSLKDVLRSLDGLSKDAKYVLGHNLLDHDLLVLKQQIPSLHLHTLPVIDTLFLSPIAFPENPYHQLVKDYRLVSTALNDPVNDAQNAAQVFRDECAVFEGLKESEPELVRFYAWAFESPMRPFFEALGITAFSDEEAQLFFVKQASCFGCQTAARLLGRTLVSTKLSSAYVLAWLRVAGSNSILPPWVRHRFPDVGRMVRSLRNKNCLDASCAYCQTNHNPQVQLKRFFGFDDFRPTPAAPDGGSLQEAIIRTGMNDEPLLAILPTGGGKSLCFQLPALVRNQRCGVLSIVISPLQALMKDQVDNLNQHTKSSFAAALYGMLTPPERGDVLERVRLGDVAVLYISPEQLRNNSFRNMIKEREIGCWIFDEAHCLSRWGHSFRPDYLYASRFIRELAKQQHVSIPPVACFTATAKRDVINEIAEHFRQELSQELHIFDGGAERSNLRYDVQVVNSFEKRERVQELLKKHLPTLESGSSVVYCATRKGTEEMAESLQRAGLLAEAFHAGLEPPEKRRIQEAFIAGTIQHICATNAFGMGIDKENVRLVIHADIPGSLENYVQEAGRAGRDRNQAKCILLYDQQDVETQFALSAFSRLTRHDIAQILRGLRRARRNKEDAIIITAGEILRDELVETDFTTLDPMAPTKINTAVSMLERGRFVERNENKTNVLQVQPLVRSVKEAVEKIDALHLSARVRRQWLDILGAIFNSDPNQGISADNLAELPSMVREESSEYRALQHDTLPIIKILNDMVNAQIVKKDTMMSAYVKVRCANPADKVFAKICALEKAMLAVIQESEPDAEGWLVLGLRRLNQRLHDEGFVSAPETLINLFKSLSLDGKGLAGNRGSIELKYRDKEHYRVKLQRSWEDVIKTAEKRHAVAGIVLQAIIQKIPPGSNGEHLVEFSESDLLDSLKSDMFVAAQIKDFNAAIERGLLFLHEQKVLILQQGLAVFRQAMTIKILPESKGRTFTSGDFSSLKEHYKERNFQIHVMNKYAALGLEKITTAIGLVTAYFTMSKTDFVKKYFAGEKEMLERATSAESYQTIVDQLNNAVQTAVVSAPLNKNMLILAGPGSGKTRVIAHRCAYLLRVERVRPREILVVCFNRSAAISLRQRIRDLVGKEAAWVTVQTYHGLAMRLIGASFSERSEKKELDLDQMIPDATKMLRGECDVPGLEPDEMRERLLSGYRHILIDEYQDIDQPQYEMISAIAGRTLESENKEAKLSILAVGDDDQNIYSFRGANVQFIRQFEFDYAAKTHYLIENYRSTANIIHVSNQLIALNKDRMKTANPIQINTARKLDPQGEPIRIMRCKNQLHQARYVLNQIKKLRALDESIAVFARTKKELHAIRAGLEAADIPSVVAAENGGNIPLHRMREPQALIQFIKKLDQASVTASRLKTAFKALSIYRSNNPWCGIVDEILATWEIETNNADRSPVEAVDFIYEALHERQRERVQENSIYLSTVHAAKGLEFDHVIMLGNWARKTNQIEQEEERRLYYVGMTRAKKTLTLCELENHLNPHTNPLRGKELLHLNAGLLSDPPDQLLNRRYQQIDLSDMWLAYPTFSKSTRLRIEKLSHGDLVRLEQRTEENRIFIRTLAGEKVGALSVASSEKWKPLLPAIQEVRIHSIIQWKKEFLDQPSEKSCPDNWEIPLLEIVSSFDLYSQDRLKKI